VGWCFLPADKETALMWTFSFQRYSGPTIDNPSGCCWIQSSQRFTTKQGAVEALVRFVTAAAENDYYPVVKLERVA
jgi:hypothetical protein